MEVTVTFIAISAKEFLEGRVAFQVAKAGDIDPQGLDGSVQGRRRGKFGKFAAAAAAAYVGHEVVARAPLELARPLGYCEFAEFKRMRRGFLRLRAEDDSAGLNFARRARGAVDVKKAARAIAIGVHQDFGTMALEINAQFPDFSASGTVVKAELK